MYLEHFKLKEYAFSITPNPAYFLNTLTYKEALNVLLVSLRSGDGFVKVTGEVGTGKTLLCHKLQTCLGKQFATLLIQGAGMTEQDLYYSIAVELGLKDCEQANNYQLIKMITARLNQLKELDKRVVLLVDEAQQLTDGAFEAIRTITNIETASSKLLQVVLFGQPELDHRLGQEQHRQLKQRIIFSYKLQPIDPQSLSLYVHHRLKVAGFNGSSLFTNQAVALLHSASKGIPRLVNILCHKSMISAYGKGDQFIKKQHMLEAIKDTEGAYLDTNRTRYLKWGIVALTAILLGYMML